MEGLKEVRMQNTISRAYKSYRLSLATMYVYSALLFLTREGEKVFTMAQLHDWCSDVDVKTIKRALVTLVEKALLHCERKAEATYCLHALDPQHGYRAKNIKQDVLPSGQDVQLNGQNVQPNGQDVQVNGQDVQVLKEKKNQEKKENIKESNIVYVKDNNKPLLTHPSMNSENTFYGYQAPTWEEVRAYAEQQNLDMPIVELWFCDITAKQWIRTNGTKALPYWKAALGYFIRNESKFSRNITNHSLPLAGSPTTRASWGALEGRAGDRSGPFTGADRQPGEGFLEYKERHQREQAEKEQREIEEKGVPVTYAEYLRDKKLHPEKYLVNN